MDSQYQNRPVSMRNATSAENPFASSGRSITAHSPPLYDKWGYAQSNKQAPTGAKIPPNWEGAGRTRTQLLEDRRIQNKPNINQPSGQEVKRYNFFDKDDQRRQSTASWDFNRFRQTSPSLGSDKSAVSTLSELKAIRAQDYRQKVENQQKQWEDNHPVQMTNQYVPSEFFKPNPQFTSIKAKREAARVQTRLNAGLGYNSDIKVDQTPTVAYLQTVAAKTQVELRTQRKTGLLHDLDDSKNLEHVDGIKRVNERENAFVHQSETEGQTYSKIMEQSRRATHENNIKKFSNLSIGVHGKELPKFKDNFQEYWTAGKFYNPAPTFQSQQLMQYKQKPSINDPFTATFLASESAPTDPFKTEHQPQERKLHVVDKPNNIVHSQWQSTDPLAARSQVKATQRWSETMNKFKPEKTNAANAVVDNSTSVAAARPNHSVSIAVPQDVTIDTAAIEPPKRYTPAGSVSEGGHSRTFASPFSMKSALRSTGFHRE